MGNLDSELKINLKIRDLQIYYQIKKIPLKSASRNSDKNLLIDGKRDIRCFKSIVILGC